MQNQIGYVIWGIKHEFSKKIFSNNIDIRLINSLFDVRDLFQGKAQQSFSIEKVFDYTLVTLYDPSTIDSSEARKAYIAFTISIHNDCLPNRNILEWLSELKFEYEKMGDYAMNENFNSIIENFSVVSNQKKPSNQIDKTKTGFYDFSSPSEIIDIFSDLDTMGYPKIHFFNPPNSYVASNPNFEKVISLERKYSVQIINFIPHEHQLFVNDNLIKPHQTSSGRVEINDLRKKDNIKVKRGSSQAIVDLFAKDQHEIILPNIEQSTSNTFTIHKLDKEKYNVKVNGVEVITAYTLNGVLKINISTPHVVVEIIDKKTYKTIKTHDTRILKSFELTVSTDNDDSSNGKNTKEGNRNANNRDDDNKIIGQKSKRGLVITLISLVLLAGTGITGWQLGWFETEKNANATTNEVSKNGTSNVTKVKDSTEVIEPINPEGYTVKPGSEAILTSKGLLNTPNNRFYRFFNDKWEFSEKNTPDKWNTVNTGDLAVVISKYFSFNTVEQNNKAQEKEKEKVKKDDPKVKIDEKGKDDTKKEEDPCKATCTQIKKLNVTSVNKTSPKANRDNFIKEAKKYIDSNCDCNGEKSILKNKYTSLL